MGELGTQKAAAQHILEEVRAVAAEQGVSKQAIHFKSESDAHKLEADKWRTWTLSAIVLLVVYGVFTIFLHKFTFLKPESLYDAIQLAVSKVLIFVVFAHGLVLCAKNFLAHKHNEVVNKHRQNALATFTSLAEAASDPTSSDVVLARAASCIFSPQDTAYVNSGRESIERSPILQILPRIGSAAHSADA